MMLTEMDRHTRWNPNGLDRQIEEPAPPGGVKRDRAKCKAQRKARRLNRPRK